ncbi:MAG: TetR/AcrR family transcriptional regulator [Bacteroidetes bacterium]|nr:MAG: TetR/AcrR family transcriptional regulator [Bacteroidota bacterium]REK06467.1 MAG: TetR/AcrR family transcriptional regulator [Bacteroidota bacterium]REK33233.1 MAG: TetR/AcrR family transcriptional regulator [Bacteroidota bacterium]REK47070.1 MAG: TetR/AcrR family transcriptional regulator [Bacteroidota bacterium]
MESVLNIKLSEKLYHRNPVETELGRKIISQSIELIHELGIEDFTFRKLALYMNTTEAGIYRYFENKYRLLTYLVDWYWSWLEFQISVRTKNLPDPETKIKKLIHLLGTPITDDVNTSYVDEKLLYEVVVREGVKTYLTKNVEEDNKANLFKPYKDLCKRIEAILLDYNSEYKYPRTLASTIIETGHFQSFFSLHLPGLTDLNGGKENTKVIRFLEDLVFSALSKK